MAIAKQQELQVVENRVEEVASDFSDAAEVRNASAGSQRFVRLFDYLFVLRPTLFFPVWTVFAAGFFMARRGGSVAAAQSLSSGTGWVFIIAASLTALMGSVFVLNQIVDIHTDRVNNKLFLIANGYIRRRIAYLEAGLLCLLALGLAFGYSGAMGGLFVAILWVTGIFYSLPPFLWKDRPVAGLVANMLGAMLIFAAGWAVVSTGLKGAWLHSLPYALAVGAVYLFTTIPDKAGDERFKKLTFAVKYGDRCAIYWGTGFEVAALVTAVALHDPIILYPALLSAPFFLRAAWFRREKEVVQAIKFPILLLALAICVYWPFYLLVLLGTFYLSKWYYRRRFGLRYPSLNSD